MGCCVSSEKSTDKNDKPFSDIANDGQELGQGQGDGKECRVQKGGGGANERNTKENRPDVNIKNLNGVDQTDKENIPASPKSPTGKVMCSRSASTRDILTDRKGALLHTHSPRFTVAEIPEEEEVEKRREVMFGPITETAEETMMAENVVKKEERHEPKVVKPLDISPYPDISEAEVWTTEHQGNVS